MEADIETIYRTFYEERAKRLSNITLTSEYKIVGFFLLKDKNGKNLSDSGVVRSFDNLGWVIGVHDLYKVLNKHVHFSPAHLKLIFDEHKQIVLGERMIARNQEQIDSISEQYQAITKVLIHILDLSLDDLEQHQQ